MTEDSESSEITKVDLQHRIARSLLIFLLALISLIVIWIGPGIHWQFWVLLGIIVFCVFHAFRNAHRITVLEDKQKKNENPTP